MRSTEDIIALLGGAEAAATRLGVGTEALRKWRQNGAIPSKHWSAILAMTRLTLADLPGAAAPKETSMSDLPDGDTPRTSTGGAHSRPGGSSPRPADGDPTRAPDGDATRAPDGDATRAPDGATAALVLADGSVFWGRGFGAHGNTVAEICFNTGMTGYQETLTDPSYAGQIINFTFPHIGNVGCNTEDEEAANPVARGLVVKQDVTEPANYRSTATLQAWLKRHGLPGIAGVDTRALTMRIRDGGAPNGVLHFPADGVFDVAALAAQAAAWPGLEGMDLAREVTTRQSYHWQGGVWAWDRGFPAPLPAQHKVVALDYGAKRNIFRSLAQAGCDITVLPATATGEEILAHKPDGVFLSNGPGDPAATGVYAVPAIQAVMRAGVPIFGICLGHQLLALALGAKTYKLERGHRGANQPVQDLATGKVEITAQNHGFAVDDASLPEGVRVTHRSLFDGSNEGIACDAKRAFSVQYHPEASPGPSDSFHLFGRFTAMMEAPADDRTGAGEAEHRQG